MKRKVVTASTDKATFQRLYKSAESIASQIEEFLEATTHVDNLDDFLDEYDLEHIGKAMDALYDAARFFANEVRY